jgi:hypothetical protein
MAVTAEEEASADSAAAAGTGAAAIIAAKTAIINFAILRLNISCSFLAVSLCCGSRKRNRTNIYMYVFL